MPSTLKKCFFALLAGVLISSCGAGSDKVRITLVTNIGAPAKNFHDLKSELFQRFVVSGAAFPLCAQNQIYALARFSDGSESAPVPVHMITNTSLITSSPTTVDYLNTFSYFASPITFDIPAGKDVEVGLIGAFYEPPYGVILAGMSSDGMCAQQGGLTGPNPPFPSATLIGHTHVSTKTPITVALPVWYMNTLQTPTISSTSVSSAASHDFVGVSWVQPSTTSAIGGSTTTGGLTYFSAEYPVGSDGTNVTHRIVVAPHGPGSSTTTNILLPYAYPYTIHTTYYADTTSPQTYDFTSGIATPIAFPTPVPSLSPYEASTIKLQDISNW